MSHRVQRLAMALVLGCALAVCAGAGVAAAAGASPHARMTTHAAANSRAHRIVQHDSRTSRPYTTALNVAIVGTAAGSSGSPPSPPSPAPQAIDGDASTQWCATQWTGSVTVDLGSVRTLDGFGLTLGDTATTALANISAGTDPNSLQPVPDLQQQTPPAGKPVYWPLRGTLRARYIKIDVTDNDGTPPCIGEFRAFSSTPSSVLPFRGADLSFEPQEEAAGAHFTDGGLPGSALSILNHHGLNYVRLRLWVDPPPGYSNLASDLKMAQRIKAAGDKLYLDIHYSDFWADPQHQDIPASWQGQDLAQLTATMESYTRSVIQAFAAQGTPVDMVSIGNEIRNGILWPVGQVNWTADTGWSNLVQLLKAGVAGAHEGNPAGHKLLVMLHFDEGGNNADSVRFFDHMIQGGVPFDVIGLSYYSFFHGHLNAMRSNVDDLATRYGKPIVIAESQYAWTLAAGDSTGNFVWQTSQLERGYPANPGGQESFYNDALSILAQVPHHLALGLFYWEPEWIPGVGWEPGAGTPNDDLTLFSFTGKALPSVGLFQSPLTVCEHFDPWFTGDCEI
jgi:arabinogalactan endo-1,4-beta-galactosidase